MHESKQDICVRLMEADQNLVHECCDNQTEEEDSPKHLDASKLGVDRFSMNSDGSLKEKSSNVVEAFHDCGAKAAETIKKLKAQRMMDLGPCEVNPPTEAGEEDIEFDEVLNLFAGEQSVKAAFSAAANTLAAEHYKSESNMLKKVLADLKINKTVFTELDKMSGEDKPIKKQIRQCIKQ